MTGVFNRFPGLCAASSIASRNDIFSNGLSFHSSTPHSFTGFSVEGCLGQLIKAQEILDFLEIGDTAYEIAGSLPYGTQRKVEIARALASDPRMLLLDEPTAGQDYRHYTEIMEFLKEINENSGITIIMITHDMHLMLEYTDRAIVIADGHLIADDTPAKVLTNETIADKAYLKKTSLYDLALDCQIEDPSEFVERFIAYEREKRGKEEQGNG